MIRDALVSDELWEAIEPWLPPERWWDGRPRIPDRAALAGSISVLRHGLRWRDLLPQLGCGSGVTCWRRLRRWQDLGVWAAVHHTVLNWLGPADPRKANAVAERVIRTLQQERLSRPTAAALHPTGAAAPPAGGGRGA